eukprot:gene3778-7504_t
MSRSRQERVEIVNKQVVKVRQKILNIEDNIRAKSRQLKKEKEDHTHAGLSKARNDTHNLNTDIDKLNRPSDQSRSLRTYSKMDTDLWTRDEVRWWFNKNGPDAREMEYFWSSTGSGYNLPAGSNPFILDLLSRYNETVDSKNWYIAYIESFDKFLCKRDDERSRYGLNFGSFQSLVPSLQLDSG